jgi:hypothetical protein
MLEAGPYDWGKVFQGDRFFALLKIRSRTYGAKYAFSVPCQNDACRARIEWELGLNELPCRPALRREPSGLHRRQPLRDRTARSRIA